MRTMLIGLLMMLVGGAISLASFSSAKPGGSYYVMTGLIVIGAINFIIGLVKYIRNRN